MATTVSGREVVLHFNRCLGCIIKLCGVSKCERSATRTEDLIKG